MAASLCKFYITPVADFLDELLWAPLRVPPPNPIYTQFARHFSLNIVATREIYQTFMSFSLISHSTRVTEVRTSPSIDFCVHKHLAILCGKPSRNGSRTVAEPLGDFVKSEHSFYVTTSIIPTIPGTTGCEPQHATNEHPENPDPSWSSSQEPVWEDARAREMRFQRNHHCLALSHFRAYKLQGTLSFFDPTLGRWSQPIEATISIAMLKRSCRIRSQSGPVFGEKFRRRRVGEKETCASYRLVQQ